MSGAVATLSLILPEFRSGSRNSSLRGILSVQALLLYCIYETYGIEAYESGEVIRKVGDSSTDKSAVSELVRLFNKEELSILHLDIAIEDFLYDHEE